MYFSEAFKLMESGLKVKLPSWGGYWYWSKEKKTIIMHTKDGIEMDIRETQVPEYTFKNIASDDWIVADEKNCPELGGENTFSFGEAIKYLKRGFKVARKGWNGKGIYLEMYSPEVNLETIAEAVHNAWWEEKKKQGVTFNYMTHSFIYQHYWITDRKSLCA